MLQLAIVGGGFGMGLPIVLLVMGMSLTPLLLAVADHLGVFGIGAEFLAPVLAAPSGLTLRATANGLVGAAFGRLEGLLAKRAAARRERHFLQGLFGCQSSGNQICSRPEIDVETCPITETVGRPGKSSRRACLRRRSMG